jgi:LppX_LprAFG lipoprotein
MRQRGKRALVVGLGVATLLTAAACGHKADKADHPRPAPAGAAGAIRAAYDKTAAMKSAKVDLTVKTTGQNASSTTGTGEVDFVRQAADLTLQGGLVDGVEVKLTGGTAYAKVPEMARSIIGNGKPWVKVNVSTLFGKNGGPAADNPTDVLKELNAVSDNVQKVGTEKIRGTQTTHYRAHLDPAKAATQHGGAAPSWLADVKNATVDVWLDDKGAVRQVSEKNNTDSGTFAATVTLYDLGTKVSVSTPPADQVADAGNLESLLGGMHK